MTTGTSPRNAAPRVEWLGDTALRIAFDGAVLQANARVHALASHLRALAVVGVRDVVPAMASLTVHLDAPRVHLDALLQAVDAAGTAGAVSQVQPSGGRAHVIAVTYGRDDGPDLPAIARLTGLTEAEVVVRHQSVTYRVYFLGFRPGFPYLGPLPDALRVPRRRTPRARVPAGAVAIADAYTGVYPADGPGGWHLIGRTDVVLFEAGREAPSLLAPGDTVRFVDAG